MRAKYSALSVVRSCSESCGPIRFPLSGGRGVFIGLRLRGDENVCEHPIGLAPSRQHLVGSDVWSEYIADSRKQGFGDIRIMLGLDAGFHMARDLSRHSRAKVRELVDVAGVGKDGAVDPRTLRRQINENNRSGYGNF